MEQLRQLSVPEARRGYPVRLRGVVTCYDPAWPVLFVQDATGGAYVNAGRRRFEIQAGQMTANAMKGDRERCLAAGMDDYISKPVRMEELQAALSRNGHTQRPALRPTGTRPSVNVKTLTDLRTLTQPREPDLVGELVDLFLTDTRKALPELRHLWENGNLPKAARLAHTLRSSCANIGAEEMSSLCAELEQGLHESQLEAVAARQAELEQEFHAVRGTLTAGLPT